MASNQSSCDLDRDKLINRLERTFHTKKKLPDTDSDGLTDFQELRFYGTDPRKADTDGDGRTDGDEVLVDGTDPLDESSFSTANGGSCPQPNFDAAGNTTSFLIPASTKGNIVAGDALYSQRCGSCHPDGGVLSARHGYHLDFERLNSAIRGSPMFITNLTVKQVADLVAALNQDVPGGDGICATPNSTPTPTGPTPTPTVTPTPYAPPMPCPGGNFDSQGNTMAFGIPAPLIGNISAGVSQYNSTCGTGGCHGGTVRNPGMHFAELKLAVISPPMSLSGISDQAFANIVAFLNQADTGGCVMGTPTVTPTPNPVQYGMQIFISSCSASACHALNSQGRPRQMDRHPSRNQIHEALRQGPSEMPQFLEYTLGQNAPPYSPQEEALYQYLHTVP